MKTATTATTTKKTTITTAPNAKHAKYNIQALLAQKFGYLGIDKGVDDLQKHCNLTTRRTVADWLKIEAGSSVKINHLVLPFVLQYFNLQTESQLFTTQHKSLLNPKK